MPVKQSGSASNGGLQARNTSAYFLHSSSWNDNSSTRGPGQQVWARVGMGHAGGQQKASLTATARPDDARRLLAAMHSRATATDDTTVLIVLH